MIGLGAILTVHKGYLQLAYGSVDNFLASSLLLLPRASTVCSQ